MEIDNKPKYYGSMVRVSVTTKGGIEYTVHLEDVDAIPIEWMYEWRAKNNEQYNVGVSSFSQMINDWEKENSESLE